MKKTFPCSLFGLFLVAVCMAGCGGGAGGGHFSGPPVLSTQPPPAGTAGTVYSGFTFAVVSGGQAPFTWSETGALPSGLFFSNAGVLSGTPTAAGSFSIMVTVNDSSAPQQSVSHAFIILINPPLLTIAHIEAPTGRVGSRYYRHCAQGPPAPCYVLYGFQLTASGGVPPYVWSWVAAGSSLPQGLGLYSGGLIDGRPTTAGSYPVVVTVKDSENPASQASANYSILVVNPPPPVINTTPAPSAGAINLPYSFSFRATNGLAPLTWSETGPLPPGLALNTGGELSGTPTALGSFPVTVVVKDSLGQMAPSIDFTIQVFPHGFKATGTLGTERQSHTATLLPASGKVLIAGGYNPSAELATAELYDPASGSFAATGGMSTARPSHTATLLKDGRVLVAGGAGGATNFATAELFDPASGTFTLTGSMGTARSSHTGTLLDDGKVLVAGGGTATAELFDPASGTFSPTGSMLTARTWHTATFLNDGKVLVAGGGTTTAELFDPASGTFTPTGSMVDARGLHTATRLNDGKVLVTGGEAGQTPLATAELFDPSSGTFTSTGSMALARVFHTARLLNDGTVLVVGGANLATAELFDPASGVFTPTGSMGTARSGHTATLLNDGNVLVAGGQDTGGSILATAELYQ